MCGIAGILMYADTSFPLRETTEAMLAKIAHRGPDDEGITLFSKAGSVNICTQHTKADNNPDIPYLNLTDQGPDHAFLALGHRRLSIIDQRYCGHQPMCTHDQSLWITYNGEVYNYQELRQELEKEGFSFYSGTDSEVVLNAYKFWGKSFLKKLNGMFSFVIYDTENQKVFAARDAFGVKPFYFFRTEKAFVFASEQKAFLAYPGYQIKISRKSAFNYLTVGAMEDEPENFWKGIEELPPAHFLELDLDTKELSTQNYYQLKYNKELASSTSEIKEKKYVDCIEELLFNSVRNHLKADVEVGSCLSGGIDSSVIVGMVAATLSDKGSQHTFSSIFEHYKKVNESEFAALVANKNKTVWDTVSPTSEEFIKDFKDLVYTQDVPFFSSSTYSQYRVMKLVAENGIKVTLDGQGADELFSGYVNHYSSYMWELLSGLQLKTFIKNASKSQSNFSGRKNLFAPLKYILAEESPDLFRSTFIRKKPLLAYMTADFWEYNNHMLNDYYKGWSNALNRQLHNEFTGTRLKNLMRTGDRNSMRFSVESRVPFVDDINLVEYVFSIPGRYKIKNQISKHLLREAAKLYLPKEIYKRKDKIGFATPEKVWLQEQKNALLEFIPQENDRFVEWRRVRKDWDIIVTHLNDETSDFWRFLNFAGWNTVYMDK